MVGGADLHEGGEAASDRRGIDEGHSSTKDALVLKALDPSPTRCGREADPFAEFGGGEGSILLEETQ